MAEDKVKMYYDYLQKQGEKLPSEESFRSTLSDPEKAEKYYGYLKGKNYEVPETKESFFSTFNVKKKGNGELSGGGRSSLREDETPSGFRTVLEREPDRLPSEGEVEVEKTDPEVFTVDPEATAQKQKEDKAKREEEYGKFAESVKPFVAQSKEFVNAELEKIGSNQNYFTGAKIDPELGDYPPVANAFVRTKQVDRYKSARRLLEDIEKFTEDPTDKGLLDTFWKGLSSKGSLDLLTLGYSEMFDEMSVADAAQKSRDGRTLTPDEETLLATKYIMDQLQSKRDMPSSYNIGAGVAEMVPYIAQIALTKGIGSGVSSGAKQLAKGQLRKIISKYGLGELAGAAASSPFMGIMWESVAEKRTGELGVDDKGNVYAIKGTEESPREAIAKAWTNTTIELFTERFVGNKLSNLKLFGKSAAKAMKSPQQAVKFQKAVNKFKKQANWDGLMSEWGEEQISAIGQAITTGDASIQDLLDAKNQFEMFATIAIAGGAFKAGEIPGYVKKKMQDNKYDSAKGSLDMIEDQDLKNQIIKDVETAKNVDEIRENLQERGYEQLDPVQQKAILDFVEAKIEKNVIDGMEPTPMEEEMEKEKEEAPTEKIEPKKPVVEAEKKPVEEIPEKEGKRIDIERRRGEELDDYTTVARIDREFIRRRNANLEYNRLTEEANNAKTPLERSDILEERSKIEAKIKTETRRELAKEKKVITEEKYNAIHAKYDTELELLEKKPVEEPKPEVEAKAEEVKEEPVKVPETIPEIQKEVKMLEGEKESLQETLKEVPKDQKPKIKKEIETIDNQITNLKTKQDEKRMQERQRDLQKGEQEGEGVIQEKPDKDTRARQREEVLTEPDLVDMASKVKDAAEFKEVFREANLPEKLEQKFYDAYDVVDDKDFTAAAKNFIKDVKLKAKEDVLRKRAEEKKREGQKDEVLEVPKKVVGTKAKVMNESYKHLKEEVGGKKAAEIIDTANNLFPPTKTNIVQYRQEGVVTKEDDKYTIHFIAEEKGVPKVEDTRDITDEYWELKKEPYAREIDEMRKEGEGKEPILTKEGEPIRSVYSIDRAETIQKAQEKVGNIQEKKPEELIAAAESMEELDYLLSNNKLKLSPDFNKRKDALRKEGKLEDEAGRIKYLDAQLTALKSPAVEEKLKKDLGGRYDKLKARRPEVIADISERMARLSGAKFAVGEDGGKPDPLVEVIGLVKDFAELGLIDIEVGVRDAIAKLKTHIDDENILKAIDDNTQGVVDAMTKEGYPELAVKKEKPAEKKEAKEPKKAEAEPPKKKPPKKKEAEKEKPEEREPTAIERATLLMKNEENALDSLMLSNKKNALKWFRKLFVDVSENFKVALIKEDKEFGSRAADYFNEQAGASGQSNIEFKKARKDVLGPLGNILSSGEQKALEKYIQMNRIVELDKLYDKRGEERLKHPEGYNLESAQEYIDMLENNDPELLNLFGLKSLDLKKIKGRADNYYQVMQGKLDDLYENGIINKGLYEKLKQEQPYYSPRQYVQHFIDKIDKDGSLSGIEALSGGSLGSQMTDAQTLMADVISRTNNVIKKTETLRALNDFAVANPNSDVVKSAKYSPKYVKKLQEKRKEFEKKKEKDPEAKMEFLPPEWDETPRGYTAYDYKDNGVTKRLYINNDYAEEFMVKGFPDWLNLTMNALSWVSGTKILKAFATGYNPEFILKNIPLDMMHIMTTTEQYSPVLPVATAQMLSDMKKVMPDLIKRKGRFKDYIEEGGGMDFLTTQGSLSPKKFKRYNKYTASMQMLGDMASYLGNTSELLTRLALRERSIQNFAKEFKKENGRDPSKSEMKEIQKRATAQARNYLDFSQGGHAVQLLNNVIPYLNAGVQVTRGTLRAAKNNPKLLAFKVAQLGLTASAIMAWNLGLWGDDDEDEESEQAKKKREMRQYYLNDIGDREKADNFIMMTPLNYTDSKGEKHYVYFKFPKDDSQKIITGMFEGSLMEAAGYKKGLVNKQRLLEFQSLFRNVTNLGNQPPTVRALLGYDLNKDLYYKEPIWKGEDVDAEYEYVQGRTPERYKTLGKLTGLSPARSQYAVQQFTTRSNVFGSMFGESLDFAFAGFDQEIQNELNKSTAEHLIKSPFSRRFFKQTSRFKGKADTYAEDEIRKMNVKKKLLRDSLEKKIKESDDRDDIVKWIVKQEPKESEDLMNMYVKKIKREDIDYRVVRLTYFDPVVRARVFYKMFSEADEKEKIELLKQSKALGGVITQGDFAEELLNLMSEKTEDKSLQIEIEK